MSQASEYIDNRNQLDDLYQSQRWRELRQKVLSDHKFRCDYCGKRINDKFIVHHKQLATRNNFFDEDNLVPMHVSCHNHVTFIEGKNKFDEQIKNNFNPFGNSTDLF